MATSFDEMLQPKPVTGRTRNMPNDTKENQVNAVIQSEISGENNKPYQTLEFKGLVLYVSILSLEEFEEKYDKNFIQFCNAPTRAEGTSSNTENIKILEAIVYVQELCSCLPQPDNYDVFFKKMKALTDKKANSLQSARNENKNNDIAEASFKQIERYPKAYVALRPNEKISEISPTSIVDVKFPHQFDFSYAAIIATPK